MALIVGRCVVCSEWHPLVGPLVKVHWRQRRGWRRTDKYCKGSGRSAAEWRFT